VNSDYGAEALTTESRVFTPPEPLGQWLARGARAWSSYALLAVHIAGVLLAFTTLRHALQFRLLLQILWDRVFILGQIGPLWLLIPLVLLVVLLLAAIQVVRSLQLMRKRQTETDAYLKLRVLAYIAIGCVAFNAFVLSTPETFSGPFRLRFPIVGEISAALAYGLYVLWLLALPRLRRSVSQGVRRGLDVLCMNALLIIVLTELSLRVLAVFWASPLLVTESSPSPIRRDSERRQPGQMVYGFPMNAGGHHDSEFLPRASRTKKTVVSIGDSFSYGVVPHAFHFSTIAEREGSGFEIYNMGYPGIGPIDYVHLLKNDALPLQPDLLLIQIFVGNDIGDSPSLAGPARWHDADSYLTAVVWYRLQMLRRAKKIDLTQSVTGAVDTSALADSYPWLTDPSREPASIGKDVYLQLELQNARSVSTTVEGVYESFFEVITVIKYLAGDIPVGFVLIPDEFQVEDDLWNELVAMSDVPLDRDRPQKIVADWMRRVELPVLDLLPVIRAVEPMPDGRRHVYHLQDTHFNVRGNAAAGRALARFVDSVLSAPPKPRRLAESLAAAIPPPLLSLPRRIDLSDSTTRQWMSGWHPAEEAGGRKLAWSSGTTSVLKVSLPTDRDIRMSFEALPYEFRRSPTQFVTVVLNGTVVDEVVLRSGVRRYSVTLPVTALKTSPQTLEFRYAYVRKPSDVAQGSSDVRELAVAWYSLAFGWKP
jgi:hypothetical protein